MYLSIVTIVKNLGRLIGRQTFSGRIEEIWCVCCRDPRDKVVWKGCVCLADRYTFLHSGCPLPGDQERAIRNEGVGIALDEKATVAWKDAGEVWEAVSSRIISARFKWVDTGKKKERLA